MAKGDIISRLKLESGEFDSKIKRAGQELLAYAEHCRKMSQSMGYANRDAKDFAKALGSMQTVSQTARGKINELSEAFVNAKVMYKNMTDEEKKSEFGKNLAASLDQLKSRLNSAKQDLADVNKELSGGGKFGQFGSVLDTLGSKMGVTGNLSEMLTSKTALMTAGIGAATAIVGKATQEWAKYNAELAKQDQITTVTTGLQGPDSDRMTDQARAMVDTYGVDFREAINAANTLMTQFGESGEQAMSLISDGMQGMIRGDGPKLLSMIQQYAPSFRDAGVSASQLVAVIQNSEGGIFTDQNMNAIVMGIKNIRLMTDATSQALAKMGIDGKKMSEQLSNGTLTIFDALKQVSHQLQTVDSNSKTAGEVMQQVFGRQGVTAGTNLAKAIETLNTNLDKTKRQTGEVGDAYNDLYNANVKLNGAIRDCFEYDGWDQMATGIKAKLVSALASVLDLLGRIKGALGGFSVNQQQGDTRNGGGVNLNRMIANLGDGKSDGKKVIYQKQIQQFSGQIFRINDQIRQIQEKAAQDMDGNMAVVYEKQIRNLENRKQAIQRNMAEYERRAQAIFSGANVAKVNPGNNLNDGGNGGPGNKTRKPEEDDMVEIVGLINNANERVSDLQNRMRESWDQNEIVTLRKQLKEAQNDLDVLQGKLPKDTVAQITVTADTADALKNIQNVEGVTIDPKTFSITATDEALPLLREIDGVTIDDKTMTVTANTSDALKALQGIEGVTIDPKTFTITATDEAMPKLREIEGITIDGKTMTVTAETADALRALQGIEGVTIDPKTMTVTADTSEALQEVQEMVSAVGGKIVDIKVVPVITDEDVDKQLQKQFGKAIEVPIVPKTMGQQIEQSIRIKLAEENMEADMQTLRTLIETSIKNGVEGVDIPSDWLIEQIFGEGVNIPDEYWKNLQEQINEKLRDMGVDPIEIDFKTGKDKRNKDDKKEKKDDEKDKKYLSEGLSQLSDGLNGLQSGFLQLGIDLGEGFGAVVGGLQTVTTILMAIQALVGAIETISALDAIIPFAGGGIVKAAMGTIVGNSYSGDNLRGISPDGQLYGLNAGEVVLNRSQVNNLANALTANGDGGGVYSTPYVQGEMIFLGVNNYLKRSGRGEIVTSKRG